MTMILDIQILAEQKGTGVEKKLTGVTLFSRYRLASEAGESGNWIKCVNRNMKCVKKSKESLFPGIVRSPIRCCLKYMDT